MTPYPLSIGRVALVVNDLDGMARYYREVVGLAELSADGETVVLGAGERPLLELRGDAAARPASPHEAGLFHTAFLLPGRAALGAWLRQATERGVVLTGASDHQVSEALYLRDPEGNGIEIYRDRAPSGWRREDGRLVLVTEPLDLDDLAAAAEGPWAGAPEGSVVGHVHLQVGDLEEADAFYGGTLGLELTGEYPGAHFWAAGGYHHHLATNVWNSRGAPPREGGATGLAEVELHADADLRERIGSGRPVDPWGTVFVVR